MVGDIAKYKEDLLMMKDKWGDAPTTETEDSTEILLNKLDQQTSATQSETSVEGETAK